MSLRLVAYQVVKTRGHDHVNQIKFYSKKILCVNPVCKSFNATFHVLALYHFIMNDQ
jgi:hypothetical protein